MVAATSLFPFQIPRVEDEQRILLSNVPWATYEALRDGIESASVRMTYLEGQLEIMSPSRGHEVTKTQIGRLVELFCLERDIPLFGYGSTTFRKREKERGLEADECYARGGDKPIPDFALEVVATRGSLDKLEVYRGLSIGEVWCSRTEPSASSRSATITMKSSTRAKCFPSWISSESRTLPHSPISTPRSSLSGTNCAAKRADRAHSLELLGCERLFALARPQFSPLALHAHSVRS